MSRLPGRQRYLVTPPGRMVAVCFVKTEGRVLTPGLMALDPGLEPERLSKDLLSLAWRRFDRELEEHISHALIAT